MDIQRYINTNYPEQMRFVIKPESVKHIKQLYDNPSIMFSKNKYETCTERMKNHHQDKFYLYIVKYSSNHKAYMDGTIGYTANGAAYIEEHNIHILEPSELFKVVRRKLKQY